MFNRIATTRRLWYATVSSDIPLHKAFKLDSYAEVSAWSDQRRPLPGRIQYKGYSYMLYYVQSASKKKRDKIIQFFNAFLIHILVRSIRMWINYLPNGKSEILTLFQLGSQSAPRCNKCLMRHTNCSAPIPPPGKPRGQRKNACDRKGRGTRKKGEISDYIGRGKEKIKW